MLHGGARTAERCLPLRCHRHPIARARPHVPSPGHNVWPQAQAGSCGAPTRRCLDDPPSTILVVAPDTMLTMDAMVACSAATCDASRPPYSRSCTAPGSTGLSLYNGSILPPQAVPRSRRVRPQASIALAGLPGSHARRPLPGRPATGTARRPGGARWWGAASACTARPANR
jgi:hypothetical protein